MADNDSVTASQPAILKAPFPWFGGKSRVAPIMPSSWECVAWKSHGGYANQGNTGNLEHRTRERIWFSPHCLKQPELFDTLFA